ncbi:MAG: 30S ribosomal protein S2 [Immundisolibacter sp.]
MRDLLDAGVHFGHQTRYWSPAMAPYIYGARQNIHIINLERSLPMLRDAMNALGKIAARGGTVLFVGTKRQARKLIEQYASACGMPYINHRWLGGLLTNYRTVRKSVDRLIDLETRLEVAKPGELTKREIQLLNREREKLARSVGGIRNLKGMPDALFVIDTGYEHIAVEEANRLGIPVIAVVDTNNRPEKVDYVIPGNDDSIRAIDLYLRQAAEAIQNGRTALAAGGGDEFVEIVEAG